MNSFKISILFIFSVSTLTNCQMSDYAEKEDVHRNYEAKVVSDTTLHVPDRKPAHTQNEDSIRKGRNEQTAKEILFTTP